MSNVIAILRWVGTPLLKTKRFGYLPLTAPSAKEISDHVDENLFKAVRLDNHHVLHDLFPATTSHKHFLGHRAHNFVLPKKTIGTLSTECFSRTFIDSLPYFNYGKHNVLPFCPAYKLIVLPKLYWQSRYLLHKFCIWQTLLNVKLCLTLALCPPKLFIAFIQICVCIVSGCALLTRLLY